MARQARQRGQREGGVGRRLVLGFVIGLRRADRVRRLDQARASASDRGARHVPSPRSAARSTIDVTLADVGTGLAWSRVEVESGGTTTVLADEAYPRGLVARQRRPRDHGHRSRSRRPSTSSARDPRRCASMPATTRGCAGSGASASILETPFTIDLTRADHRGAVAAALPEARRPRLHALQGVARRGHERRRGRQLFLPRHRRPLRRRRHPRRVLRGPAGSRRQGDAEGRRRGRRRQSPRGDVPHRHEAAHLRRQDARHRRRLPRAQGPGDPARRRTVRRSPTSSRAISS